MTTPLLAAEAKELAMKVLAACGLLLAVVVVACQPAGREKHTDSAQPRREVVSNGLAYPL